MRQAVSKTLPRALLLMLLAVCSAIGQRADAAEKKVVLQINDNGPEREATQIDLWGAMDRARTQLALQEGRAEG